jgi:hypothetical protein
MFTLQIHSCLTQRGWETKEQGAKDHGAEPVVGGDEAKVMVLKKAVTVSTNSTLQFFFDITPFLLQSWLCHSSHDPVEA